MDDKSLYRILCVDDDEGLRKMYQYAVSGLGYPVETAADGVEAINMLNTNRYDVVLLDLLLPRVDGFEVLAHVREHCPSTEVLIITAVSDVKSAVRAVKEGAYDFIAKPVDISELALLLERCLEKKRLMNSTELLKRSLERVGTETTPIGESEVWLSLLEKARKFAETDALVYLEGETGSGKEVIAKYLHLSSARKEKPFVAVDCGVIPDTLIETELFGYAKGAFTGAATAKVGLVELAHGGTLLLDEIGHIDANFQQKLLKFVETKKFRRIGDTSEKSVDVRIIAATNKDLAAEAAAGRFRSDLWYRLNVMKLEIPPLRAREGDARLLAEYFLKKLSPLRTPKTITPEVAVALQQYAWPGNVRELQSLIQRAVALSDNNVITLAHLGLDQLLLAHHGTDSLRNDGPEQNIHMALRDAERLHVRRVLESVDWNISQAAKILQIGRNTLYGKIQEFELRKPDL